MYVGREDYRPWGRSFLKKKPDNIISSEYAYDRKITSFTSSSEKGEVNMFHLLSMEYARIWHEEKKTLLNKHVFRPLDNDFLVRRYTIRGLLVKKKSWERQKYFKMKKFENVPPRVPMQRRYDIERHFTEEEKREILEEAKAKISLPPKRDMSRKNTLK